MIILKWIKGVSEWKFIHLEERLGRLGAGEGCQRHDNFEKVKNRTELQEILDG